MLRIDAVEDRVLTVIQIDRFNHLGHIFFSHVRRRFGTIEFAPDTLQLLEMRQFLQMQILQ